MVTQSSEQIPQLPEFNDTAWIDSTMQAISNDEIHPSSLLLYVISCSRSYIYDCTVLRKKVIHLHISFMVYECGEVWLRGFEVMQVDKHTHRQTDALITALRNPSGAK